jgi:uncharacterized membrane protein
LVQPHQTANLRDNSAVQMETVSSMTLSCPACAARMPETAAFCPGCGIAMKESQGAKGKIGVFPENIAAVLAYLTFIPAVIFLASRPYRRNLFLRFHAVQCLFYCAAVTFAAAGIRLVGFLLGMIPIIGPLVVALLYILGPVATIILWAVLCVKALRGEQFKLPVLGDLAEKYAALQ